MDLGSNFGMGPNRGPETLDSQAFRDPHLI
jgi:hypothetical protein